MEQDVKFVITDLFLDSDAGGGQVGRASNDRAGLVLVEAFRAENVELGVKTFGRMGAQFDLFGDHVVNELKDAGFDIAFVFGTLDVVAQPVAELIERFGRVG